MWTGWGWEWCAAGQGSTAAKAIGPAPDPAAFQEECLRAFEASQVARGFSELTIGNGAGLSGRPSRPSGCGPGSGWSGRCGGRAAGRVEQVQPFVLSVPAFG